MIGISTGGPQALSQFLPLLTAPMPPILIVQHMIAQFTGVFANRLDRTCSLTIKEAAEGDLILPNRVLIAPGGRHMLVAGSHSRPRIAVADDPPVSGHKPSVDVLFQSAARVYQSGLVGVIMTGMGRDGVDGCKTILAAGGFTLGQDEATSVVYGMNKAAHVEGALKVQFALDDLPGILKNLAAFREEVEGRNAIPEPLTHDAPASLTCHLSFAICRRASSAIRHLSFAICHSPSPPFSFTRRLQNNAIFKERARGDSGHDSPDAACLDRSHIPAFTLR